MNLLRLTFGLTAASIQLSCVVSTPGPPGTAPTVPLPPQAAASQASGETEDGNGPQAGPTQIGAGHILISYKGAMRAAPYIDRTKAEAKKFAGELRQKATSGEDFAVLAREHSDDPGSAATGGSLGTFTRAQMVPAFSDAAFALEIGAVSEVVESPFGFHVIKRSE